MNSKKKIKSIDTGNMVFVETVTNHPERHPKTYQSLRSQQRKEKEKRLEEYAGKEFEGEYDNNIITKNKFPDAFSSKEEFIDAVKKGKRSEVSAEDEVDNSTINEQKKGDYKGLFNKLFEFKKEPWIEKAGGDEKKAAQNYKKYLDKIIETADKNSDSMDPVIIGVHKDEKTGEESKYLVAGNSRAMVFAYLGKKAPTVEVPLKGRKRDDKEVAAFDALHWATQDAEGDEALRKRYFKEYLKENDIKISPKEIKKFLSGKKASAEKPSPVRVALKYILETIRSP